MYSIDLCLPNCAGKEKLGQRLAKQVSQLVGWCFEPSQPQRAKQVREEEEEDTITTTTNDNNR